MKINFSQRLTVFVASLFIIGCSYNPSNKITEIHVSSPERNALKVKIVVGTSKDIDAHIDYWEKGNDKETYSTLGSKAGKTHQFVLMNLKPLHEYEYKVVTSNKKYSSESKTYTFATSDYPMWLKDIFKVICPDTSVLPEVFRKGYTMLYRREAPGLLFFLNNKGEVVWYHQVNGTGFKCARMTQNNTVLSILGTPDYQTSYGNEILELSLTGDTLFHLKKGERDLKQTIHHDIVLNNQNQIVTICSEEKIMDLKTKGGNEADTIKSDGILVLDRNGKQVWKWTVFDVLNPLEDKDIIKDKKDWMHANCINIDKDGNYLLSFYNNGQIWKIDSKTGKVLWKFGKGGDFDIPEDGIFDNSHAVHFNSQHCLMLFDNGTNKLVSRALAFNFDEINKKVSMALNIPLPRDLYSERMGSAYLVNDSTVLQCSSKKHSVVLTNLKGRFLWALKCGFMPYRSEFIPAETWDKYFYKK